MEPPVPLLELPVALVLVVLVPLDVEEVVDADELDDVDEAPPVEPLIAVLDPEGMPPEPPVPSLRPRGDAEHLLTARERSDGQDRQIATTKHASPLEREPRVDELGADDRNYQDCLW